MIRDLILKLKSRDLESNQFTYEYFSHTDHILTDDYYEEISELSKVPSNRILLLKLLYGVSGLGKEVENYYVNEYISYRHHVLFDNFTDQFVRIIGESGFLAKHVQELHKDHHFPYIDRILYSSRRISSSYHIKQKLYNIGTFHYKEYVSEFTWTGKFFSPKPKSIIRDAATKAYSQEYTEVYRSYLRVLLYIFNENPNNLVTRELGKVFSALPKEYNNYDSSFGDSLQAALDKAKQLRLIMK